MNWPFFWQLLATAVVAFMGAWLAHTFAASRDRKNKRREQRIAFLIEAYRRLEFISNRPSLTDAKPIESAVADIQLFGSPSQIQLVRTFVREFASTRSASLDPILEALRKDLRAELQLESDPEEKLLFLRYTPKTEE
jgi:hypothetical protein